MGLRVLRIYHSAVVDEYRERERMLIERHGHDVHLVCPPTWTEGGQLVRAPPDDRVPTSVIDRAGPEHPILFRYRSRALRRVLRQLRPHIVDLQEEPYSLAVASALRAIRVEVPDARVCVYSAQNIFKRYPPPFRQLERRALSTAAAAYPCSTEAGQVLRSKGYSGQVAVIPLGVSIPQSLVPSAERALRVGFVGRLEPYKGGLTAIEAFAAASRRHPEALLEVVGAGSQEPVLRARTRDLGLEDRVRFTGALPQAETLRRIAGYAVALVPSLTTTTWKEQFGRVAVQAMAAGTPVIASDSGSLAEVVGDAGVLVPEQDTAAFATALDRLLEDPVRRTSLARQARARALERFSWEAVADAVDAMYSRIIGRAPC